MNDLDPLPLDDVLAIAARRSRRRQRIAVGGTLGAGAVAAMVFGISVSGGSAPSAVVADGGTTSVDPTTSTVTAPTTTAPVVGRPEWQFEAASYAVDTIGFDYDNAEELAAQWQVEPYTTKIVVGEAALREALTDVSVLPDGRTDARAVSTLRDELFDAFWSSDYDIDDAELLGAQWETPVQDSKLLIGVRIAGGQPVAE